MLRYLLDTNLCIRVLRDRPQGVRKRFNAHADALCISTIVLTEVLHGAEKSARPEHNRKEVERFAAKLDVLAFDAAAADHSADNLSRLPLVDAGDETPTAEIGAPSRNLTFGCLLIEDGTDRGEC